MLKRTGVCFTGETAKSAEKILLLCVLGVLCGFFRVVAADAAPPVKSMYTAALAREQSVRAALDAPDAAPSVLVDLRAAVTAYESVVRHYPASGYSDDALWQAGRLSLDAFARFGQPSDKDAGVRILKRLAASYPTSKLARQVPEQLAKTGVDESPARPEGRALPSNAAVASDGGAGRRSNAAVAANAAGASNVVSASSVGAGLPPSRDTTTDHRSLGDGGQAGPASRLASIRAIRRSVLPDAVRITIELDTEVPFHEERIQDPARVFVDLPGTRAAPTLVDRTIRFESDADIVRQIRVGRHPNNTTRVVLDAAGVTSYSVYPLYSPYRLVIDCVRVPAAVAAATMTDKVLARVPPTAAPLARQTNESAAAAVARPLAPLTARTMTNPWLRRLPGMNPKAATLLALARQGGDVETTPPAPAEPSVPAMTPPVEKVVARQSAEGATAPPAHNATGGLSIARQLGLGVSRIVIDPGHGGHDPGAKGKGITEA
jgi:N-acetylmuramoyl-L-alanine amidase